MATEAAWLERNPQGERKNKTLLTLTGLLIEGPKRNDEGLWKQTEWRR
jgi:hypothetical protein